MSFAQNLKYIKEKENLTNYRLAKLFGCSQSSLINWLDNGVVPHPKTRQKIADHFGITLAALDGDELPVLPEKGAKKAPDPKTEGVKKPTPQRARTIRSCRRLLFSLCCHCRRKSWSGL